MCAAEYMQNLYLRGDGIYTLILPFHSWKRAPEEIDKMLRESARSENALTVYVISDSTDLRG